MNEEFTFRFPDGFREQMQETLEIIRFENELREKYVRQHWWQFWRPSELTYIARRMGW